VAGRRVATDYGGDLLVLSQLGVLPLSKLVVGGPEEERSLYATYKVGPLFNTLADTRRSLQGWALHIHPSDNALLVLVPEAAGSPTTQLAYSFASKGWSRYRDLPMLSCGVWGGSLYFGTADGRICRNEGYADNVSRTDSNVFTAIDWSVLSAYQNLGTPRNKRVLLLRPTLLSDDPSPLVEASARFGYDLTEALPPSATASLADADTWDNGVWDTTVWGGDQVPSQPLRGGAGLGRDVAIAVRGSATSRTTLVGVDVVFDQGGLL
jgi:hypothetical protein